MEAAILHVLLAATRPPICTFSELQEEVDDQPSAFTQAIEALSLTGVIEVEGATLKLAGAVRCAARLLRGTEAAPRQPGTNPVFCADAAAHGSGSETSPAWVVVSVCHGASSAAYLAALAPRAARSAIAAVCRRCIGTP